MLTLYNVQCTYSTLCFGRQYYQIGLLIPALFLLQYVTNVSLIAGSGIYQLIILFIHVRTFKYKHIHIFCILTIQFLRLKRLSQAEFYRFLKQFEDKKGDKMDTLVYWSFVSLRMESRTLWNRWEDIKISIRIRESCFFTVNLNFVNILFYDTTSFLDSFLCKFPLLCL